MKIYSISVVLAPPSGASVVLSNASDLSSFSFYQRGSAGEFMTFLSKTVAERTPQGQRQTVQEQSHVAHVYNRGGTEELAGRSIFRIYVSYRWLASLISRYYHRRGISCSTGLLPAHKDSWWIHYQSPPIILQQPVINIFPWNNYLYPEVPGPETGRYHHEGTARIGWNQDCLGAFQV